MHEDWKESKKVVTGEEAKGWKFEMDFSNFNLEAIKLPVEYDMGVTSFKETMEPTEINAFDDLIEYPQIELLDYELNKYQPNNIPVYFNYFPIENTKPFRPGAEYEYSLRGVRGDPELYDKKPEEQFALTPISMEMPLEYNWERLVIPNPLLREYIKPDQFSEIDVENPLKPRVRSQVDVQDEITLNHRFEDQSKILLRNYLPGNVGSQIARRLQTRVSDNYTPSLTIKDCIINIINRLFNAANIKRSTRENYRGRF